jgi:hypothetical protein
MSRPLKDSPMTELERRRDALLRAIFVDDLKEIYERSIGNLIEPIDSYALRYAIRQRWSECAAEIERWCLYVIRTEPT